MLVPAAVVASASALAVASTAAAAAAAAAVAAAMTAIALREVVVHCTMGRIASAALILRCYMLERASWIASAWMALGIPLRRGLETDHGCSLPLLRPWILQPMLMMQRVVQVG